MALSLQLKHIISFWALAWMNDVSFFGTVSGALSDLHFSITAPAVRLCYQCLHPRNCWCDCCFIIWRAKEISLYFLLELLEKAQWAQGNQKWPQLLFMSVKFSLVSRKKCWQNHWWAQPYTHHAYHIVISIKSFVSHSNYMLITWLFLRWPQEDSQTCLWRQKYL